jgi:hypothetical protein
MITGKDVSGENIKCHIGASSSKCFSECENDINCKGYNFVDGGIDIWEGQGGCCTKKSAGRLINSEGVRFFVKPILPITINPVTYHPSTSGGNTTSSKGGGRGGGSGGRGGSKGGSGGGSKNDCRAANGYYVTKDAWNWSRVDRNTAVFLINKLSYETVESLGFLNNTELKQKLDNLCIESPNKNNCKAENNYYEKKWPTHWTKADRNTAIWLINKLAYETVESLGLLNNTELKKKLDYLCI